MLRNPDVYPGSRILTFIHPETRIPNPTTAKKEEGGKILSAYLFYSHKYHKIYIILLCTGKEKKLRHFTQNYSNCNPKNCD